MDEYAYEMEAMSRGRFGRNMRHEASKQARRTSKRLRIQITRNDVRINASLAWQARHESKRARKLQAKADRLHDRIGRRLEQMGATEMRLPRLERLATALGLSDFEKNVVVAMIGQVLLFCK